MPVLRFSRSISTMEVVSEKKHVLTEREAVTGFSLVPGLQHVKMHVIGYLSRSESDLNL